MVSNESHTLRDFSPPHTHTHTPCEWSANARGPPRKGNSSLHGKPGKENGRSIRREHGEERKTLSVQDEVEIGGKCCVLYVF